MAISVHTLRIDLGDATHAFPVLSLLDRRKKPARRKQFCLVRAAEIMLFIITSRSLGRFASLLQSMSMEDGVLVACKASVDAGVLTANEFDTGLDFKCVPADSREPCFNHAATHPSAHMHSSLCDAPAIGG